MGQVHKYYEHYNYTPRLASSTWNILICFNVPDSVIAGLQESLPTIIQDLQGPSALHIPLLEQLTMLYDMSIGHVQGTVASIEEVTSYWALMTIVLLKANIR